MHGSFLELEGGHGLGLRVNMKKGRGLRPLKVLEERRELGLLLKRETTRGLRLSWSRKRGVGIASCWSDWGSVALVPPKAGREA